MSKRESEESKRAKSVITQWVVCAVMVYLFVVNIKQPFGYFCLAGAAVINPWIAAQIAKRGTDIPIISRLMLLLVLIMIGLMLSPSVMDLSAYYTEDQLDQMQQEIYPEDVYGTASPDPSVEPSPSAPA